VVVLVQVDHELDQLIVVRLVCGEEFLDDGVELLLHVVITGDGRRLVAGTYL
jgi:hypothetical protein